MILDKNNIPNKLNKFIVIEGINGCGKTTLIANIKDYLENNNKDVICSKEPGGTPIGDSLRNIALSSSKEMTPEAQFFIMSASRAEYVFKKVRPTINNGSFFISDRYYYSSLAFQSYAGGLNFNFVYSVSKEVIKECIPDITFILDLDLETASKRLNLRNENSNEKDSFESEKMEYHQKVRNGFLDLSKKLPERFVILDATKNKEQVFNEAISILKDIYKL